MMKPISDDMKVGDSVQLSLGDLAPVKKKKKLAFRAGYSESLWKSLVVKALRLGWPNGLRAAAQVLPPSAMKALLLCGLFEDTFPAMSEIGDVIEEVAELDYDSLCLRETHHGRGLSPNFVALKEECLLAAKLEDTHASKKIRSRAHAAGVSIYIPPRALNCVHTWLAIKPQDAGVTRSLDSTPWTGMPESIADSHTYEGRRRGVKITLLSGHYVNHEAIGQRVMKEGWDKLRADVHRAPLENANVLSFRTRGR